MKKSERKRLRQIAGGDKTLFKPGDKVEWTYDHWLNSKSCTRITKEGVFVRYINSRYKTSAINLLFCYVHWNGNKNPTRISAMYLKLQGIAYVDGV